MATSRRDFIRSLGIGMASLILANCVPTGVGDRSPRSLLRLAWLRLEWLAGESSGDSARGEAARAQLVAEHQAALDGLIAAGEISEAIAEHLQAAFLAASYHVFRSHAPITCYEPVIIDYTPASSEQLRRQAEVLAEMGETGELDAVTLAQAQATLERDIAFLSLPPEAVDEIYSAIIGSGPYEGGYPGFDNLSLEVPADAAAAARFLIDVLAQP